MMAKETTFLEKQVITYCTQEISSRFTVSYFKDAAALAKVYSICFSRVL